MTQSNIGKILLPIALVPLSVIITINVFAGGGNQLGNTFVFLMLLGGTIGFFTPKKGLLLFLVAQFYMDFFKRLLVLGDALSLQDVMASLGLGPIIIVMACVACVVMCMSGQVSFSGRRDWLFLLGCIAISLLGAALSSSQSLTDIGQSALGTAMLGMTAFACYILFRTSEDTYRALKFIMWGAVPMALYAVYQAIYGISVWEETYIRTGMSQVLYNFYVVAGGVQEMRPFSTLNNHSALGAAGGLLFATAIMIMTRTKRLLGTRRNHALLYFLLSLLMLATCAVSQNRTTYFLPIFAFALVWFFSGGFRTLFFYLFSAGGFVAIVLNSEYLNHKIIDWTLIFEKTAIGQKFGSIGTFQDRLKGFINLSDPNNWTPFGVPESARDFAHDQITEILLKLGYVPLCCGMAVVGLCISWWHRSCLKIADPNERRLLIFLTAILVATGICGLGYGNLIFVAPINSMIGILLGLGMSVLRRQKAAYPSHASERGTMEALGSPSKAPHAEALS
jgi:hypothetical protein